MPGDTERENLLQQMREKRNISEVLFKKFTEAKDYFSTHAFCFYEGEDGKYYDPRIAVYWDSNFIPLVAGNKKEVLKIMQKIQSDSLYTDVCVMYFVDRDYDTPLANTNKDLFETPCYSIENLYAQESVLQKILQAEFGLSFIDSDYHKCIADYRSLLSEFNDIMFRFNAIVKYQHTYAPEVNCRFSNIKTSHLAHIAITQVAKSTRYDEKIAKLSTLLNADEEVLATLEKELRSEEQPHLLLRGKNQLDFFVTIIGIFKKLNAAGGYFSNSLDRVYINLSDNRLSELSQYAVTPPELDAFLSKHQPKAVS